jgi:hypothetical protein
MAVADFAEDFERRLHIARETYRDQEKRVAQEQADSKRHTEQLLNHVLRRFSELARAAPDGLMYERGMSSSGAIVHELIWIATRPHRRLEVWVEPSTQEFWWRWGYNGDRLEWKRADQSKLSSDKLDELIHALADQEKWWRSEVPDVGMPGTEGYET